MNEKKAKETRKIKKNKQLLFKCLKFLQEIEDLTLFLRFRPVHEMEDQCSPFGWGYCYQEEGMEELRQTFLYTTLELETTILSAKEEITKREVELIHLKDVLGRTIKERDEAQTKCQTLILDKLIFQQQPQQKQQPHDQQQHKQQEAALHSGTCSSEDESKGGDFETPLNSSEFQKDMVASPIVEPIPKPKLQPSQPQEALKLAAKKPLPEKGKLLQAVMEAGPLLQTLLLAGPLPQWQHPPPQLNSIEIPPVAISSPKPSLIHQNSSKNLNGYLSKKRGPELSEGPDSSPDTKHHKVVLY